MAHQDKEIKVEFMITGDSVTLIFKKVKGKKPLTAEQATEVARFLKKNHEKVIEKWEQVFIYHQSVKCEVIGRKK